MFCPAVSHGNSAASWNIRAGPPAVVTVPGGRGVQTAIRFSRVDFPHPEAPSRQTNSPGATDRLMLSSAATLPRRPVKTLVTASMMTAASPLCVLLGQQRHHPGIVLVVDEVRLADECRHRCCSPYSWPRPAALTAGSPGCGEHLVQLR